MPPMAFVGRVTKVGCMQKTATVTVTRWVVHKKTGKVRVQIGFGLVVELDIDEVTVPVYSAWRGVRNS